MELLGTTLDTVPDLSGDRGSALGTDKRLDAGVELSERVLDVGALGEASSEEGSVDGQEDPRSALEDDGREENADPEEDLEGGNNRHGRVIVLLNKSTDLIRDRVVDGGLGLGRSRGGLSSGLGSNENGNEVGASVGSDVEDGVDSVGEESKRVLRGEEPDKGQAEILDVLIGQKTDITAGSLGSSLRTSALGLVDNDTVGQGSSDK